MVYECGSHPEIGKFTVTDGDFAKTSPMNLTVRGEAGIALIDIVGRIELGE